MEPRYARTEGFAIPRFGGLCTRDHPHSRDRSVASDRPTSPHTRPKGMEMITATPFTDLSTQMTGRVVTPSDDDWDATRQVFNLATDVRPAAIALPHDVRDVVAAVG